MAIKKVKSAQRLAEVIENEIVSGELSCGKPLGREPELINKYSVNLDQFILPIVKNR